MRTMGFLLTLAVCVSCSVLSGAGESSPLYVEKTEQLTEGPYEMVIWWNPLSFDELWLLYGELAPEGVQTLKYRIYDGEWSSPHTLADKGEFITAFKEGETLIFFWNTMMEGESEIIKSTCVRQVDGEWSQPLCVEPEPYVGDQFCVKFDGEIWLLWSRIGFWEYQVFQGDHWGEKQVLLTVPEEYYQIHEVVPVEDELQIFYERGRSDIYCRKLTREGLAEPEPVVTEGFPYLHGAAVVDGVVMAFLEVQAEGGRKTLVYTEYDEGWGPLGAVATPEDGYLAGGSFVTLEDGRLFVFWSGTQDVEEKLQKADIYYRVYDGNWSEVYQLTDTPDVWETSPTAAAYQNRMVIVWREKDSQLVYASHVLLGEGEMTESDELPQVTPQPEPEEPERTPPGIITKVKKYVKEYIILLPVGGVLALLAVVYFKKKKTEEVEEKPTIGRRRMKKVKRKK